MSSNWNTPALMERVRAAANKALFHMAEQGANAARDIIGRAPYGTHSAPGEPPNWQTGDLHRGITARAAGDYRAQYGTTSKHGLWMEKGVPLIRPVKGKFLPVPVNLAAQVMARKVAASANGLRSQNLKLIVNKQKKQALLVEMTKTGRQEKKNGAVFVLKHSVTIKPRPWLVPSYQKAKAGMRSTFEAVFDAAMRGAA